MVKKEETKTEKPKWAENKKGKAPAKEQQVQIVRLMNTDLDGNKSIFNGLRRIRGISFQMSNIILKRAGIPHSTKTSNLTEPQISALEKIVKSPSTNGIPDYFLNVRRNIEDGKSFHLTGSELEIFKRNHLAELKKLGNYVGVRHRLGKRVRGQRTRSTGRGHKTVGVTKPGRVGKVAA